MKISLVISEGVKQVMMTPETDHERNALKFISPTDGVEIAQKWGTFDNDASHVSYNVGMCKAGYLRRFAETDSLLFVIKPKDHEKSNNKEG